MIISDIIEDETMCSILNFKNQNNLGQWVKLDDEERVSEFGNNSLTKDTIKNKKNIQETLSQ